MLVCPAAASAQAPAYAPPAWFTEGVELVKQKEPAANCEPKNTGDAWAVDEQTCFFEGRPVSGAVANGRCGTYVSATINAYSCVVWYGALALHSCSRYAMSAPDAWRGGKFDANAPYTSHAELVECLDAESPAPRTSRSCPASGSRNPVRASPWMSHAPSAARPARPAS